MLPCLHRPARRRPPGAKPMVGRATLWTVDSGREAEGCRIHMGTVRCAHIDLFVPRPPSHALATGLQLGMAIRPRPVATEDAPDSFVQPVFLRPGTEAWRVHSACQRSATSDSRASQSSSRLLNARHDDVTPFAANSHDDHLPRPLTPPRRRRRRESRRRRARRILPRPTDGPCDDGRDVEPTGRV